MSVFNTVSNVLYLISILLLFPCTAITAIALCFGKKGVSKGLWIVSAVLSILSCILLTIFDLLVQISSIPHADWHIWSMFLSRTLLPMLCFLPAVLFPLVSTFGRKGGWKPILLIPALIASIVISLNRMNFVSLYTILLVMPLFIPLILLLILAAVWYYTGKNRWVGLLIALIGAGVLLIQPFLSSVLGLHMIQATEMSKFFQSIVLIFRMIFKQGPLRLINMIRTTGFPLSAYVLISQFAIAGLHSARLPKEKDAK